jgi:hypothetical protein
MPGHAFLSKSEWWLLGALVAVVSLLTTAERTGLVPLNDLASSPHAVAEARLWSLVTSALLVSYPIVWSLVTFAFLAALTLRFCGSRVLLIAGVAGHIGSTLAVYAVMALTQTLDPHAFEALSKAPDYGVSAVSAAWIGALAAVSWQGRNRTLRGRIVTALAVVGAAAFGWIVRGHVNFLDLEHIVAFGVGVGVVAGLSSVVQSRLVEIKAVHFMAVW